MTDARQAHTRWSAAALLAPTAAAHFTGATAWTLHHPPSVAASATPATVPSAASSTRPPASPDVIALRGKVRTDAARAAQLQKTLAALKKQAALRAALAQATPVGTGTASPAQTLATGNHPPAASAPTQVYTPPAAAAPARPVTPAPAAPPPPVARPVPVAAPPVHTTTGASAPKP